MFRKILISFVMGMLLIGAAATGTSFPVLLMMGCLLLIALTETETREEQDE